MFVNDSKATNPDSSIKAVQSYNRPIVLIAGGMDKMCIRDSHTTKKNQINMMKKIR